MANDKPADGYADLTRQFQEAISGLGSDDLRDLARRLLALGSPDEPLAAAPRPSRRRPRRADVVTYRVRVDLEGTSPPVWRRLELASDMFLDELHGVIQTAFGWTDSHLHRFGSGPDFYSADTEYYLCPFDMEEGEPGVPEERVRLDEVLIDSGDKLFYVYDFGDDWQHVVKLEAVAPRPESAPRAICTAGRRPGPPEDCGGVAGYELIVAATDPSHADHAQAAAQFADTFGEEIDRATFELTDFDIDEINDDLGVTDADELDASTPEPLADLVRRVRNSRARSRLESLIRKGHPDSAVQVDVATAGRMVRPYAWLLDRVGDDGIKLTGAGYLPPVHVEAASRELGLDEDWIGKHNRENQTLPVLELRESAHKLGLLRKYRGMLLLTRRGGLLRGDPVALWWHLAQMLPLRSTDGFDNDAGLLLLVAVAAGVDGVDATVAELLGALGWMRDDGAAVTRWMAAGAAWTTRMVLIRLGVLQPSRGYGPATATAEGIDFSRAALSTWPAGA